MQYLLLTPGARVLTVASVFSCVNAELKSVSLNLAGNIFIFFENVKLISTGSTWFILNTSINTQWDISQY